MNRFCPILLLFSVCLYGNELGELLVQAAASHPSLAAQRAVVEQLVQSDEELREFLDPSLYGGVGGSSALRGLPVAPSGYRQTGVHDALEGQAGVLVPVEEGAYLSVGGVFRRWFDPDDGYEDMYQQLAGVNLQIPLLRDRGFALYGHRRTAAFAAVQAGIHRLLAAEQTVRRGVEQAYIAFCAANNNCQIRNNAIQSFEQIHREACELARLKTIPEYQVQTALRDLQTACEDQETARQAREAALVALAAAVGVMELPQQLTCSAEEFLQAALELTAMPQGEVSDALASRGEYLAILEDRKQAQEQIALEEEMNKDDISLNMGATWQGDSRRGPYSVHGGFYTDHEWGGEIMVAWSRPLDYTGENARAAKAAARLAELDATRDVVAVRIASEVHTAKLRFQAAQKRLGFAREAVAAARATLSAEQERFRLGENTSTIVLDAQKELDSILLRQSAATAELLSAHAELQYALGYPAEQSQPALPEE